MHDVVMVKSAIAELGWVLKADATKSSSLKGSAFEYGLMGSITLKSERRLFDC